MPQKIITNQDRQMGPLLDKMTLETATPETTGFSGKLRGPHLNRSVAI